MSNIAIFVALFLGVAVWFGVASRLTAKPWENREQKGDVGAITTPPARIGTSARIGIRLSADRRLRFFDRDSAEVSGPRGMRD